MPLRTGGYLGRRAAAPGRRMIAIVMVGALAATAGSAHAAAGGAATASQVSQPGADATQPGAAAQPGSVTVQAPTAHASSQDSAAAKAKATGRPVTVDSYTTETRQVTANPDGTFTLTSNTQPVRVQRGASWVPVDPTLKKNPDGTLSPAAATDSLSFSGGGTGPLATLADPGSEKSVAVSWPGALPTPTVAGNAATYPNVLPGVDLRVAANATGYTEVLIVRDAAAARDPRLASLAFAVHGSGVKLNSHPDGTLSATDAGSGKGIFATQPAIMWDSTLDPNTGPAPSADQSGSGHVTQLPVSAAGHGAGDTTLTLAPPAASLTGARVKYPIYIDPQFGGTGPQQWVELANFPHAWYNSSSHANGINQEGFCGYSDCVYTYGGVTFHSALFRDYYQLDTSPLSRGNGTPAQVFSASFYALETYNSAHCTRENVSLAQAGAISSGTVWGNQPGGAVMDTESSAAGSSCVGASNVVFSNSNVVSYAQEGANYHWGSMVFELRADNEGDETQFKNFADNPTLSVTYNFAPNAPTGLTVSHAVTCASGGVFTSDAYPTLYASATDNNPAPLNLNLWFQFWNVPGTVEQAANSSGVTIGSGAQGQWTSNVQFANGTGLAARVLASNIPPANDTAPSLSSPWSNSIFFTVLTQIPAIPSVTSADFPPSQWGQAQGVPGVITVGADGASNLAGFAYSVDGGAGSEPVPSTGDCGYLNDGGLGTYSTANGITSGELAVGSGGTAQIRIPAGLPVGPHTLWVKSFDLAHNASTDTAYSFYVAPNYQTATQPVTKIEAESLLPATGAGAGSVSVMNNCCGVTWSGGAQAFFGNNAANGTFTLTFNAPSAGIWDIAANMTASPAYGRVTLQLDGSAYLANTNNVPFDGYSPVVSERLVDLGTVPLTAGAHTLTITVPDKNQSATNYLAGIDYLTLSPTNRYEAETLTHSAPSAGTLIDQVLGGWGGQWSDTTQLMLVNTTAGASYTLTFNAPVESDYALGVHMTTAAGYGTVRFDLDPTTAPFNLDGTNTAPISGYTPNVGTKYVFLGGVHLTAGDHVLKITVVGTDPNAIGDKFDEGIDYLEAAPVTGAVATSFTAAMNNQGIVSDGTPSTANFDLCCDANLSLQGFQAAGIRPGTASGPGSTFTLGGATFTMPQLNADKNGNVIADNVIADGQTIPLPAVKATGVALLVAATCYDTPAGFATLRYAGTTQPSQATVPSVHDWVNGPTNTAVLTLTGRDAGSSPMPGAADIAKLYEVMLPANPDGVLSSITLPLLTASFLPGSPCTSTNALHVLAIGTRTVTPGPSGSAWVGGYAGPIDTAIAPPTNLSGWTLRTSVLPNVTGGGQMRVRLSNAHATTPIAFGPVTVAAQSAGAATVAAPTALTFCLANGLALGCTGAGATTVTIPAGGEAYSDPAPLPTGGTRSVTVSLHVPSTTTVGNEPIHENTAATTYFVAGDATANQDGTAFSGPNYFSLRDTYYVSGIDVTDATAGDGTVAVLGDQTPTQGSPNWVQDLPGALSAQGVPLPGGLVDTSLQGLTSTIQWRVGEGSGGTVYDSAGTHNAAITTVTTNGTANPAWDTADAPPSGSSHGSLTFDGVGNGYASPGGPVVDSTKSFTLSAWVMLGSKSAGTLDVAAQQATTASGFALEYDAADDRWAISRATSDTANPSIVRALSTASPVLNTWTHLTAVYDSTAGTIALYVNGVLQNSVAFTTPIASNGPFVMGRGYSNGAAGNLFVGQISDVRIFNYALSGTGVARVYVDNGTSPLNSSDAIDSFVANTYSEPNLRDVIVSVGSYDVMTGVSEQAIEANLTALIASIKGGQVANQTGTAINVYITTIPSLGLPAGDQRETVRDDVNTWIMHNSGALLAIDTTAAGGDPLKTANAIAGALAANPGAGL